MGRAHFATFASVLSLLPVLGLTATTDHASAAASGDAASCRAMLGKTIAPHTVITGADYAPGGATVGDTKVDTAFCRIVGVASPADDSHIGFEVWLPPAGAWNGNFQAEGSGGSAGAISPGPMLAALKRGFATMSTDNGHLNDPSDPLGGSGQMWAYRHPQKMIDWGWRALHLSTIAAKKVIRQFYGKDAGRNYFIACSAGGHHAIMEATRFPADYDGIAAGAAPWKWTSLMFGHTWNGIPGLKDASAVTKDSVAILNRRMVATCDKLDGVEDGIIADPRRCTVDPGQFQCKAGETSDCLTPVQVEAARWIYRGPIKSDGTRLQFGQLRGTELGWVPLMTPPTPGGSSWAFWKLTAFQDPNFNNLNFDFDKDSERALATKVGDSTLAEVYDEKPDFTAFKARGGKFILFQGLADYQITPLMDIDFYDRIVVRYGETATQSFLRFFLLPGMGHCGGGVGFSHIGGATGTPLKDDDQHDMVKAIEAWVEKNRAPTMFIGAHVENNQVTATRPICLYPAEAHYKGSGDTKDAANFICAAPNAKGT